MERLLEQALTLEENGYQFYTEAAARAENPLTREMLLSLAQDEKDHIQRILEVREDLAERGKWPEVITAEYNAPLDLEARAKKIFAGLGKVDDYEKADVVQALERALTMEDTSRTMYRQAAAEAEEPLAKEFFRALMEEERQHYVALQNIHYYLTRSGDWLAQEESQVWNWMNT